MMVDSKLIRNLAVAVKRQFSAFAFAKRLKPKSSDAIAVLSYRFASRSDMTLEEAVKLRKNFLSPAHLTYYKEPIMLCKGEAQYVWDSTGKRYLDLLAGVVTVGVGHCHPKVNAAAAAQMKKLWHTTCLYLTPPVHEFAEKLAAKMPGKLKVPTDDAKTVGERKQDQNKASSL